MEKVKKVLTKYAQRCVGIHISHTLWTAVKDRHHFAHKFHAFQFLQSLAYKKAQITYCKDMAILTAGHRPHPSVVDAPLERACEGRACSQV